MKKIFLPLAAALVLLTSCGPTTDDAIKLNDSLVNAQKGCIQGEKDFYKSCDGYNPDEIKASYESFAKMVDSSSKMLSEIKEEKEFATFKENAVKLVNAYKELIPKEYKEYADIYSLPSEKYTAQDSARCVEVANKINTTLNPLVNGFIAEQENFAKEWKFKLK
ncbi:MAG: LIC11966 family surface protein [Bacteroidia bacterium]